MGYVIDLDANVWRGEMYTQAARKLLVLGESRYEDDYSDKAIIADRLAGREKWSPTFKKFLQAVTQCDRSAKEFPEKVRQFWAQSAFYNYNSTFFPGAPRVAPDQKVRQRTEHKEMLRRVLTAYTPTHCVVWGIGNWQSIDVPNAAWVTGLTIPGVPMKHPYCSVAVDGHTTVFTFIKHPSAAFSPAEWAPVLAAFLAI
jgi:hypothetical protein